MRSSGTRVMADEVTRKASQRRRHSSGKLKSEQQEKVGEQPGLSTAAGRVHC